MSEIQIPVDSIKGGFDDFLNIEGNSKIFFSGKFGIGKTYFLKNFFESYAEKYETFHLYPVNYQISNNDDVIELLKYDILVELLKKNNDLFFTNEVDGIKESTLFFYSWFKENHSINQFLKSILSTGEELSNLSPDPIIGSLLKLGRPLKDLLTIDEEFQKFKKEYKDGEKGLIKKYSDTIKSKNISETDYISQLLKEKIEQQKSSKKSVLVLDDLDRIDPEHIFRILNIMSAHFERENENKFGFDFIILVADYSNLRHIFHHKYGTRADFSGYIDKFFTISPYYFDNKKAILDTLEEITTHIKNGEPNLQNALSRDGYIKLFLMYIFIKVIDNELANLRELLKATKFQLSELKKGSYNQNQFTDNFQKIFDKAIKIAILSFSNTDIFIEKIKSIKQLKVKEEHSAYLYVYIIAMLKSFNINIPEGENGLAVWRNFSIRRGPNNFNIIKVDDDREEELFFDLLIKYIEDKKYIKTINVWE